MSEKVDWKTVNRLGWVSVALVALLVGFYLGEYNNRQQTKKALDLFWAEMAKVQREHLASATATGVVRKSTSSKDIGWATAENTSSGVWIRASIKGRIPGGEQ